MVCQALNPRKEAYLAVAHYFKTGAYVDSLLSSDALARQIAYGTIQRLLSLEFLAHQLAKRPQVKLKPKERALLYTTLYQAHFLQGHPLYATVNEMVELAKKECHASFARFLNALLRNYERAPPELPPPLDLSSMSLFYSYPPELIQLFLNRYSLEQVHEILKLGNQPSPLMARIRRGASPFGMNLSIPYLEAVAETDYYVQNATPVYLMEQLAAHTPAPKRILDLCAAPGGKLLLAHDLYPGAALYANDVSAKRLETLKQNMSKYKVAVTVSHCPGEEYSSDDLFDLVILDVPCSNSGVLGKRPEARWRLSQETLRELSQLQIKLVRHARTLLKPGGVIWYLTCSILPEENEEVFQREGGSSHAFLRLPTPEGGDGGFGGLIKSEHSC